MYTEHPAYITPTDEHAAIWRYMSLAKLVGLLKDQQLYFARLDRFEDPYEGEFPDGNLAAASRRGMVMDLPLPRLLGAKRQRWLLRQRAERTRKSLFANCWHANEHESAAMWDRYRDQGVALRSSFARLRDALASDPSVKVCIGEVIYRDYGVEMIAADDPHQLALSKRKSFEHERELRAVIALEPSYDANGEPVWDQQPLGVAAGVDLLGLVERVYIQPMRDEWFRNVVADIMERYGLGAVPVERSSLYDQRLY